MLLSDHSLLSSFDQLQLDHTLHSVSEHDVQEYHVADQRSLLTIDLHHSLWRVLQLDSHRAVNHAIVEIESN
jgi:hypothetical protein